MFSQEVQITFSLAVREAQRRHHEYLTSEHVLYAMLFDENAQEILRNCGGDLDTLRNVLEDYFVRHMETLPGEEDAVPEQTIGLQRILQRTVMHMQACRPTSRLPSETCWPPSSRRRIPTPPGFWRSRGSPASTYSISSPTE